jgi:hypothetical protein
MDQCVQAMLAGGLPLGGLLIVSEVLAFLPSVRANSLSHLLIHMIEAVLRTLAPASDPERAEPEAPLLRSRAACSSDAHGYHEDGV